MNLSKLFQKSIELLASVSPTPDLDTRVLFEHALSRNAASLLSHPEMPLSNAQYSRIRRLINRRKKGEPIAYITGHKEFFGLDFLVNKNVLIPRPETENLIEESIKFVKSKESSVKSPDLYTLNSKPLTILDVGTGSGCLIVSLVSQLVSESVSQYFRFYACDISEKALSIAKKNAKRLLSPRLTKERLEPALSDSRMGEVSNKAIKQYDNKIRFFHSDLFSNKRLSKKFDLIIANLPYVPFSDLQLTTYNLQLGHEPQIAIFAGDNGSEIIKRFIEESKDRLRPGGTILLELDPRNADEIEKFAKKIFPEAKVEVSKDLAKWERYLKISK